VGGYWVYVLRCSDGTLYTGSTNDVRRRLVAHNSGRGSKYTRTRTPVVVGYLEKARGRSQALKRELEIKRLSRSAKLLLCATYSAKRHSRR
jgi:predicted GIY-YIG superfamily endonuclease